MWKVYKSIHLASWTLNERLIYVQVWWCVDLVLLTWNILLNKNVFWKITQNLLENASHGVLSNKAPGLIVYQKGLYLRSCLLILWKFSELFIRKLKNSCFYSQYSRYPFVKRLKNGQTYFKRFLKYVWPFFNIMHKRVKITITIVTSGVYVA